MTREEVVESYGFAPEAVSQRVLSFGVIEDGPRKGYLCVFTGDTTPDKHAFRKPNFADADTGYDPANARAYVYIFSPRAGRRVA